jgi:hypothetical protein
MTVAALNSQPKKRLLTTTLLAALMTASAVLAYGFTLTPSSQVQLVDRLALNQSQLQGDFIQGTVYWPDGTPANNIVVDLFPAGPTHYGQAPYTDVPTRADANGHYAQRLCGDQSAPCPALDAYLVVKAGNSPFNGGMDCFLLMAANGSQFDVQVSAPAQINWRVVTRQCGNGPIYPSSLADFNQHPIPGIPDWSQAREWNTAQPQG